MLFPPKKAAVKPPKVHPRFYSPALILVVTSQIPVPPLRKQPPQLPRKPSEQGIGRARHD